MFDKLSRLFNYLQLKKESDDNTSKQQVTRETVPKSVSKMKKRLEDIFDNTSDLVLREINTGSNNILIAYIDGLIDKKIVNSDIMTPLLSMKISDASLKELKNNISNSSLKELNNLDEAVDAILSGSTIIHLEGTHTIVEAETQGWKERNVEEPNTEPIVRGPREGFVESLRTNISLLRRRIKNPKFKFETVVLGEKTRTSISICYIDGLVNKEVVNEVKARLNNIKTDSIIESGYIREFIKNNPFSLFQTMGESERPDKVAGKLLEGRAAIIVDGSPQVLTVPNVFIEVLQSSEDYYINPYYASVLRIIRFISLLITIMLPGFYVGLLSFHQGVIPFKLMLTILSSREGIPFSPFTEALIMIAIFEILSEASSRLPRNVGQAVSIAGAIVLGEAAARAGIASSPMIMVTTLTAICSFLVPTIKDQIIILRFVFLVAANILGFMGMALTISIIVIYLCDLESYGVPYLYPFVPIDLKGLKDTLVRFPRQAMIKYPDAFVDKEKTSMVRNIIKKGNEDEN